MLFQPGKRCEPTVSAGKFSHGSEIFQALSVARGAALLRPVLCLVSWNDGPRRWSRRRAVASESSRLDAGSNRNGGVFASVRLARIIDGRDVAAHGIREMPVWGDAFVASPGRLTQQQVSDPIQAIVKYLAGIQERPAE